jgi:hypothetical protein
MLVPFVAGAICVSMVWVAYTYAFTPGVDATATKINAADAHTFAQTYYTASTPMNVKLKAFTIDKSCFNALSTINTAVPTAAGFRIYLGTDASGARVYICCGVDNMGADMTGNIYSAKSLKVGPCPDVCDQSTTQPINPQ